MEHGTIEREIYIAASPDVVFEVVSRPEHIRNWWSDDARYEPAPGSTGEISFGTDKVVAFTVVEAEPPHRFSFRWTHPAGEVAAEGNSLLVTFELTPRGDGTLLRFTEAGFRELGDAGVTRYRDHVTGWNTFLPRLGPYVATVP